jgi:PASTA domain
MKRALTGLLVLGVIGAGCTNREASSARNLKTSSPRANLVAVPNVHLEHLKQARRQLRSVGLRVGAIRRKSDPGAPRGIVLDQRPDDGRKVPAATKVSLTLSRIFPEPLVTLPQLGRFLWRCRGARGLQVTFVAGAETATDRVSYSLGQGRPVARVVQPGRRLSTPAGRLSQTWRIVQGTEPRTLTAVLHVDANGCPAVFLPPTTRVRVYSRAH